MIGFLSMRCKKCKCGTVEVAVIQAEIANIEDLNTYGKDIWTKDLDRNVLTDPMAYCTWCSAQGNDTGYRLEEVQIGDEQDSEDVEYQLVELKHKYIWSSPSPLLMQMREKLPLEIEAPTPHLACEELMRQQKLLIFYWSNFTCTIWENELTFITRWERPGEPGSYGYYQEISFYEV